MAPLLMLLPALRPAEAPLLVLAALLLGVAADRPVPLLETWSSQQYRSLLLLPALWPALLPVLW